MPRRKQSNPQPVKVGAEDGVAAGNQENLESDLLLEQELGFEENDYKMVGFERDSDSITVEMGMAVFGFSDEDCSRYNQLTMDSDLEDNRETESDQEEISLLPSFVSCKQCGQTLDYPLSTSLDLTGLYCLQCGGNDRTAEVENPAEILKDEVNSTRSTNVNKTYTCKLCKFSSRYSNHLKRHMNTHNGEKPYRCPHCVYASAQLVNLQRHVRTHTGEKPYKCQFCKFACNSLGNLKRHQRMHTEKKVRSCDQCEYQTNNRQALKKHKMSHKEEKPTTLTEDAVVTDLTLHIQSDSDFLQSFDGHSPALFFPPEALSKDSEALPDLLFPFGCRGCGVTMEDDEEICRKCTLLMLSKNSGKDDKLHACTSCPFVTQYPNHLSRHMKTHTGHKPYKCPQCNYASAHFDNLKRHHRVHTGEKPYKCHVCDYACGNLANLRRHERIHSGAKPFECSVCSYSCNQSMNLKRHMLRHSGEKPFKCQVCGYTTGHWDNYKRHQKKHGHSDVEWIKMQMPGKEEDEEEGEI
ncbi:hypothetical protein DNTS_016267 [Danionella cerebrum]|uniref:Zinc finger protein 513 n=1 Tax=Danionella cerebrum TaxID=2873325 RepID=A0A553Q0V3_9TELE|nr:hypothetical protein DNTS_016267 [Danionella translucida]